MCEGDGLASAEARGSFGASVRDVVMSPCDFPTVQAARASHRRIRRVGVRPETAKDGEAFSTPARACPPAPCAGIFAPAQDRRPAALAILRVVRRSWRRLHDGEPNARAPERPVARRLTSRFGTRRTGATARPPRSRPSVSGASQRHRALAALSRALTDSLGLVDPADFVEQKALTALGATSAAVVTLCPFPPAASSSDGTRAAPVGAALHVVHAQSGD